MTLRGDRSFYDKQMAEFHKNINSIETTRHVSKKRLSIVKAPMKTSPKRKRSKPLAGTPMATEEQLRNIMKFLKQHESVITAKF